MKARIPEVLYVNTDGKKCRLSFTVNDEGPVRPCIHILDGRGYLKDCKFIAPDQIEAAAMSALKGC